MLFLSFFFVSLPYSYLTIMKRSQFALLTAVGAMGSVPAAADAAAPVATDASERRPNVIFILMDDAGYGDFGCYGQGKTETPNIDSLASRGIIFTDMYSAAPLSAPSRCCLMTGLHSGHAQIRANDEQTWRGDVWKLGAMERDPSLEGQAPMEAGTTTIATLMQQAGYKTAMVGKWGLGAPTSESTPNKMGFDFFYGHLCQRMAQNYYPQFLYRNAKREYLDNRFMELGDRLPEGADPYDRSSYDPFKGDTYAPDAMYDNILSFVRENRDEEFFLMWTTTVPHSALMAPEEYVDYYVGKFGDEDPVYNAKGYFPCRYPRATFAAMISYFDYQVGQLIAELKRLGIYDNTIIFFTSDNGPTHNAYTSTTWFDCAHPFRSDRGWTKRSLHEGGIRMPFVITWGDRLTPHVSDYIGFFPDVMPTLCDIAGIETPRTDGISMLPMLTGGEQPQHEYLYWEFPPFHGERGWLSVRMGKWKGLVRDVADGNTHMELFDIVADCRETVDLSAQHPEIVEKMWQYIRESHGEVENPLFRLEITYPDK